MKIVGIGVSIGKRVVAGMKTWQAVIICKDL
jgi:hypothetical protein